MGQLIRGYIIIKTNGGDVVKYVSDQSSNANYYEYEGNAYQELGMNIRESHKDSGLKYDTRYYFQVNDNGNGATEYSIYFPSKTVTTYQTKPDPITYRDVLNKINMTSNAFRAEMTHEKDIRFTVEGQTAGTSIALSAGASGDDLFTALGANIESANASDNYYDQTTAGQIKSDYEALVTSWTEGTDTLLQFPESGGDTPILERRHKGVSNASDHNMNRVQIKTAEITEIVVIEYDIPFDRVA